MEFKEIIASFSQRQFSGIPSPAEDACALRCSSGDVLINRICWSTLGIHHMERSGTDCEHTGSRAAQVLSVASSLAAFGNPIIPGVSHRIP